uniref:Uncharacterized protein n=1 Tax=Romanomermis culicivorax TaxID=13658 RepID=A0A915L6L1_ROMCU
MAVIVSRRIIIIVLSERFAPMTPPIITVFVVIIVFQIVTIFTIVTFVIEVTITSRSRLSNVVHKNS